MKKFNVIREENTSGGVAPAMSMGAGPQGLGSATGAPIAGFDKNIGPMMRRKPLNFAGKRVFKVSPDKYYKAINGKKKRAHYSGYVGEDIGDEVREFARTNKDAPIIVQNEVTGEMMYLRYGKR